MAGRRVVRLGRRRSAWERPTALEIAQVEFRSRETDSLDCRPSVYVVTAEDEGNLRLLVVKACAEHGASFISPPKPGLTGGRVIDLDGASPAPVVPSPGRTVFRFTRDEVHAEIVLENDAALLAMVEVLKKQLSQRDLEVLGSEILTYAAGRIEAADPEWTKALDADVKGWVSAIAVQQRQIATAGSTEP